MTLRPLSCVYVHGWQKTFRVLRCVQRVLASPLHGDAILAGLMQHRVSLGADKLSEALGTVVLGHKILQCAVEERLGADGWGVIQRAFNLKAELQTKVGLGHMHVGVTGC